MTSLTGLYINSKFCEFQTFLQIENYLEKYALKAQHLASKTDWDEIVLYAILSYDGSTGRMDSADFMLLRMPYERYVKLCSKLSKDCRLFFERNSYQSEKQGGSI